MYPKEKKKYPPKVCQVFFVAHTVQCADTRVEEERERERERMRERRERERERSVTS